MTKSKREILGFFKDDADSIINPQINWQLDGVHKTFPAVPQSDFEATDKLYRFYLKKSEQLEADYDLLVNEFAHKRLKSLTEITILKRENVELKKKVKLSDNLLGYNWQDSFVGRSDLKQFEDFLEDKVADNNYDDSFRHGLKLALDSFRKLGLGSEK